jgi:hypothetical protein
MAATTERENGMELGVEISRDASATASEPQPRMSRGRYAQRPGGKSTKTRARKAKLQLPTRDDLDGRTNTAKAFDALVTTIEADLGGADQLSAIERSLIEGFAGATITLQGINYRIALGEVCAGK